MTTTFTQLLDAIYYANGDGLGSTWPRATMGAAFAKEAMLAFPILRPMVDDHTTTGVAPHHSFSLPVDFREIISVEYPINEEPPQYLIRKNRLDPDFYNSDENYDVDRDYTTGSTWTLYCSKLLAVGVHVKTQYFANHATDLDDDSTDVITVPDEYVNILVAYALCKMYRERLGFTMRDPTAHTSVIQQMTELVQHAEQQYADLIKDAQSHLVESKVTPHQRMDKHDRVY